MAIAQETLTAEDIAFLTRLANELETQDTAFTRKPIIYQIMEEKKDVGIDSEYADGVVLSIGDDGEEFFDDDVEIARSSLLTEWEFEGEEKVWLYEAKTLEDLAKFCEDVGIRNQYGHYRNTVTFSGFFLTKSALQRHVGENQHHYKNPFSFAQAAGWRNPELERLLDIVEKFAAESGEEAE